MPRVLLFYRLMVRPLFREPLRAGLIVLAVALGVAVVLAIDFAVIANTKKSLPLIGLDLVAEAGAFKENPAAGTNPSQPQGAPMETFEHLGDSDAIWVGASLGRKPDDRLQLLINDRVREYTVRGVYP